MKKSVQKSWPYLIVVVICAATVAIVEGVLTISMMNAIDIAMIGNKTLFKKEVIRLLMMSLLLLPASILLAFGKGIFKRKAMILSKVNYIERLFNKNINEFQRDNNSKYISTLTNDVNTIETNYINGIYEITVGLIYFIVSVAVIVYVNPIALVVGITIGIISSLISIILNSPMQRHQLQRSELYESYTTYIKEMLSAFHIIKTNNLYEKVKKNFYDRSNSIQRKGYLIDKIHTYITSLQNLTMSISIYGLLAITSYMAIKGNMTLGGVILIANNMEKVMMHIMKLVEWLPKVLSTKKLFERIDETLENIDNHQEMFYLEGFKDKIQFSKVSFGYENEDVLDNINISIEKGKKYLVVGPSGGGKSTLLKLLRKYFSPQNGKILIDDKDLKYIKKESYFKHISNVEQQVFLLEDTLRNNITLYKEFTDDEIYFTMKRAGLMDFVEALPNGLDTLIYDNGKNVSGGEKSRIAIARGLLQGSDIIFLDEVFASLDSMIAKEIENTILSLKDITVINVSHIVFEESKSKYDKIFLVKNKKVIPI